MTTLSGSPPSAVGSLASASGGAVVQSATGLTSPNVVSLHHDRLGRLWVGTEGAGLFVAEAGSTTFRPVELGLQVDDLELWSIRSDPADVLWIGAFGAGGGVHRYQPESGELWSLTYDPERADGLPSGAVMSILPEPDGGVWVATQGAGLSYVDPARDIVEVITTGDGLPHNSVYGLVFDEEGALWASTGSGIARIDRETRAIRALHPAFGLQDPVFHAGSALRASDGTLWFGGPGGVNVLTPDKIPELAPPPAIVLTDLSILGTRQPRISLVGP